MPPLSERPCYSRAALLGDQGPDPAAAPDARQLRGRHAAPLAVQFDGAAAVLRPGAYVLGIEQERVQHVRRAVCSGCRCRGGNWADRVSDMIKAGTERVPLLCTLAIGGGLLTQQDDQGGQSY